jgi:serine/threonine protein kinase
MKGIKQIKNYRLLREVGKGATGKVFEAVDDNTNKKYAIKAIPTSIVQGGRGMENLKRELKLLHGLNHPNITKIAGLEKTVNNIYLVLEYCNGGNLYEYSYFYKTMYNKPLPEGEVQKILRQLIKGLEYMHKSKIVHRDIKLENILINFDDIPNILPADQESVNPVDYKKHSLENFTIKIADLGYAKDLNGNELATTICGTPITIAPEIVNLFDHSKKDQKYNSKVDLWSLGAIAYELLVGMPPFYAKSYKDLFEIVMKGVYNMPKNLRISVEAITFINGLLQFYPEKRFKWKAIKKHPFIVNDIKTFHFLDLRTVENVTYSSPEKLQINTKDCENFVWLMYRNPKNNLPLDKIAESMNNEESEYDDTNELNIGEPEEHDHINKRGDEKLSENDFIPDNYNKDKEAEREEHIQLINKDRQIANMREIHRSEEDNNLQKEDLEFKEISLGSPSKNKVEAPLENIAVQENLINNDQIVKEENVDPQPEQMLIIKPSVRSSVEEYPQEEAKVCDQTDIVYSPAILSLQTNIRDTKVSKLTDIDFRRIFIS